MTGKKTPSSAGVRVSPSLQLVFLVTMVLGWFVPIATMAYTFGFGHMYVGIGTWLFQISFWLLPVAYGVLSLSFVWKQYPTVLERFFMAGLIGTIGYFAYESIATALRILITTMSWFQPDMNDPGLWNAFGSEWATMLLGLAVFTGVLAYLTMHRAHKP